MSRNERENGESDEIEYEESRKLEELKKEHRRFNLEKRKEIAKEEVRREIEKYKGTYRKGIHKETGRRTHRKAHNKRNRKKGRKLVGTSKAENLFKRPEYKPLKHHEKKEIMKGNIEENFNIREITDCYEIMQIEEWLLKEYEDLIGMRQDLWHTFGTEKVPFRTIRKIFRETEEQRNTNTRRNHRKSTQSLPKIQRKQR